MYKINKVIVNSVFIFFILVNSVLANKSDSNQVNEILDAIDTNWEEVDLQAWVNNGFNTKLNIGDDFVLKYKVNQQSYVTFFFINNLGELVILFPNNDGIASSASKIHVFPNDTPLVVSEPLGNQKIYILSSEKQVLNSLLDLPQIDDWFFDVSASRSMKIAKQLSTLINQGKFGKIAIAKGTFQVVKNTIHNKNITSNTAEKLKKKIMFANNQNKMSNDTSYSGVNTALASTFSPQFTVSQIVNKFDVPKGSRFVRRPKLALQIKFETDSADLTESAKKELDQFGAAIKQLSKSSNFEISGHTDDVGPEEYNMALSERRASSAKTYLLDKYEIDNEQISIKGYGEEHPIANNSELEEEKRRELNRRVEFKLLRN